MNEPKWTKGPWEATIRTGCMGVYPEGKEPNCMSGAKDWMLLYQDGRGEESHPGGYLMLTDEQIANATLIAAAPELYEVATDHQEFVAGLIHGEYTPEQIVEFAERHWNATNPILSRARGEA
jgi:hypothetical protein